MVGHTSSPKHDVSLPEGLTAAPYRDLGNGTSKTVALALARLNRGTSLRAEPAPTPAPANASQDTLLPLIRWHRI